ncbi:MAG: ABC transporter ATP-binding protein [Actinomycetota bacterium]|nr:ABC transporter ATP-binding protein [Actinomycetota bacterium]
MQEPILQAVAVRKAFGPDVVALDRVDLTVVRGEWLAVSGTSGAGKSTLLQLFAALDHPTSGRILYRGQDLASMGDLDHYRRRVVGVVFQLHHLLPHLSVRDNIEIAMMGRHLSRRDRVARVSELVAAVGLEAQQIRRPPELSGGERQRAAIARALANSPEVLLADEPTGSLDPENVTRLLGLLETLNRESRTTIVMVTHDRDVAERAGRLIHIDAGRIVEVEGAAS